MNLRILLSALTIAFLATACAPVKVASAERNHIKKTTQANEREEYVFLFEKKPADELFIKEVRVFDEDGKLIQPLGYVLKTADRKENILNLKGYREFAVVATYPGGTLNAASAHIIYTKEEDGKQKRLKVKSFEKTK